MDLTTRYLGLTLSHPFIPGASPLADDLDGVRRLEDAGAAAIVLRSLFEEQIERDEVGAFVHSDRHGASLAEAMTCFPSPERLVFGPEDYVAYLRRVKEAVGIPVIASLNGSTPGRWLAHAPLMEQAGADAIELNLYHLALDPDVSGAEVERAAMEVVREVKRTVKIPLAVKLSPFFSSFAHCARQLDDAGADGLVVFNRFCQPDIDVDERALIRNLRLSNPAELPLRLRWLGALFGRVHASLAVTGGVHTALDAIKCVMAGANAVQVVSALLAKGVGYLHILREDMARWMADQECASLEEIRGSVSLARCPDPQVYERGNYMLIVQG